MTHGSGRTARPGRRRDGLALCGLIVLVVVIGSWSVPAPAESIPQAVDRMDGTLKEMGRKSRESDRKVLEMGRKLRALDEMGRKLRALEEKVRKLERAMAAVRQEQASAAASGQEASSVSRPASGSPESVETSLGLTRTTYALVQRGLASQGFAPGTPDGLVGPRTRTALRRWQAATGYEVTGHLTRVQTDALVVVGKKAQAERPGSGRQPPGTVFRDCLGCPEMVVLPAGSFMMGSPPGERDRNQNEGPVHRVRIGKAFAVGRYEVTFSEWDACRRGGGCSHHPDAGGWGRGSRPVIKVSWDDAQKYVRWLSRRTGKRYRLLSESEWEYAARAGTRTRYFWGDFVGRNRANCDGCGSRWDRAQTAPVGSFSPNAFGLHDLHGNVREWVADCWHGSYERAPTNGSAWNAGSGGDCRYRVSRGGSWLSSPVWVRSAVRVTTLAESRHRFMGFRVASKLD